MFTFINIENKGGRSLRRSGMCSKTKGANCVMYIEQKMRRQLCPTPWFNLLNKIRYLFSLQELPVAKKIIEIHTGHLNYSNNMLYGKEKEKDLQWL